MVAVELATGRIRAITARAVVLATGGCGKVFPFTTNANINTGDGMALAYRAGAPLKDMEFVQYHPTGLPFTGILITEATRAEGGWLLNKDGYRYLQDYDLGTPTPEPALRSMELGPRDRLSQAFVHEVAKGRTLDSEWGPIVHLDLRHLGAKLIDTKLPFVRELCLKYERIDPVTELIPVRPVVHYMMGGVHTDIDGATPLAGLYAAGETACVSINGANRLGSNSLPGVPGLRCACRAGGGVVRRERGAAPCVRRGPGVRRGTAPRAAPRHPARGRGRRHHPDRDADDDGGGRRDLPHRSRHGRGGGPSSDELQERSTRVGIWDTSHTFNTELVAALELGQPARRGRVHARLGPTPGGVAGRPPAHRLPRARRPRGSSPTTWSSATRTGPHGSPSCR